jgi:SAM-dependent methyltransferase
MHTSAFMLGKRFLEIYQRGTSGRILDVGSRDINGTLRPCAPPDFEYTGIDLEAGKGVDMVLQDPYAYPFPGKHFDFVISTSTFEHDKLFWMTFLECCRVLTDKGFLYINTPSNGSYHGYPQDYWRFYPDASLALQEWGRRMLQPICLVESFIAPQVESEWNDSVMIFTKDADFRPSSYLSDEVAFAHNIHRGSEDVRNLRLQTQDQVIMARYRQELERSAKRR